MNKPATDYPRSMYEARLDAECYAVSHELHARLFRRFRTAFRVATTVLGSAAFGGWIATLPELAGLAGLAVAVLIAIEQAVDPSEKIARHRISAQRYTALKRDSLGREMALCEFDERLEEIKAEDEAGIDALMVRAFNRVVKGAGRDQYRIPESVWQRCIAFWA